MEKDKGSFFSLILVLQEFLISSTSKRMGELKDSPPPQKKEEKKGKTGEKKTSM